MNSIEVRTLNAHYNGLLFNIAIMVCKLVQVLDRSLRSRIIDKVDTRLHPDMVSSLIVCVEAHSPDLCLSD